MKKTKYLLYALAILVGAGLFLVGSQNVKALEIDGMMTRLNNANIPDEKNDQGTGQGENKDNSGEHHIEPDILIPDEKPNEDPKKPEEDKKKEDKEKEKPKEDKPQEKTTPKKEKKPKSKIPNTGIESKGLTYTLITILGGALFILTRAFNKKSANN